jgi:hypothetical protein
MKRDFATTRLDHMIDIVQQHALDEQRVATSIPFLSLLRSSHPTPVTKGVLKPSCCVILQGHKRVHLADEVLDYGPGEYLVVSVDMPASGHIVRATADKPYLLLNIELDPQEIAAIVLEAHRHRYAGAGARRLHRQNRRCFAGELVPAGALAASAAGGSGVSGSRIETRNHLPHADRRLRPPAVPQHRARSAGSRHQQSHRLAQGPLRPAGESGRAWRKPRI